MTLDEILTLFYKAEKNVAISCFFDSGWSLSIGDKVNGYTITIDNLPLEEVTAWLCEYYNSRLKQHH